MTRQELENIGILSRKVESTALLLEEIRSRAYPGAIQYNDIGGSKPMPVNKLEAVMCLLDMQERRLDRLIDERYDLMKRATKEIMTKCEDPAQRHILYLRYYKCLEWRDIKSIMYRHHKIRERKAYNLHHIALNKIK